MLFQVVFFYKNEDTHKYKTFLTIKGSPQSLGLERLCGLPFRDAFPLFRQTLLHIC